MMYLRSILFVIWMYGLMLVMSIGCLPLLVLPRAATIGAIALYGRLVRGGLFVICGIRVELRGLENLPEGAFIYAAKHHCMLDVFIPFIVARAPAVIMKQELMWYPGFGWYAMKAGMIWIDRAGTTRTLKKMVRLAGQRAEEGRQIVIFPEGTRVEPGAPPAYHGAGISALAKALPVPVVPVATNAGLCWPRKGIWRRKGTIVYEFLPPLPDGLARKQLVVDVQAAIESKTNALVEEGLAVQAGRLPAPVDN